MKTRVARIFIGMVDTAGVGSSMAGAFKQMGYKVTCYSYKRYSAPEHVPYDYIQFGRRNKLQMVISVLRYLRYFIKALANHEIFIFIAGSSFLPFRVDFPILKLCGRKIVVYFCGCDIRHFEPVEEEAKRLGFKYYICKDCQRRATCNRGKKVKHIKMIEKYTELIFSTPETAHLLSIKYHFLWNPVNVDNIAYRNRLNCEQPLIIHAPSDPYKKGTSYLLSAIDRLEKDGYQFQFQLLQGISNLQVREILSEADIAVDQLMSRGYGVFAVESMAAGCAVLGSANKEYMGYPDQLPITHTDPDNIYHNLKLLLENPELRQELGEKGRKYVEKYHDSRKIANDILDLLSGKTENLVSYDPKSES